MNKLLSLILVTLTYIVTSCFVFTCCSCSTTKDTTYNVIPYEDDVEASGIFKEFRYVVDNSDINEDITDIDTVKTFVDDNDEYGRVWHITTIILNPTTRGYIEIEEFVDPETSNKELNHVIWWLYDTKNNREDIENLLQHDTPCKGDWISCKSDKIYLPFTQKGITAIRELYSDKLNTNQNGKLYLITNDYNKIGLYYCTYVE